jgi:hypothetical protein
MSAICGRDAFCAVQRGGISHHPDKLVRSANVEAALEVLTEFVMALKENDE